MYKTLKKITEKLYETFILSLVSDFKFCDFIRNYTLNTWKTLVSNLKQTYQIYIYIFFQTDKLTDITF